MAKYACRTHLFNHKNCTDCSKLLQGCAQLQEQPADEMVFIRGGLCVPSDQFVSFITNCEEIFSSRSWACSIGGDRRVNAILLNYVDLTWFTVPDCSTNLPSFVRSYIKMRICYAVKFLNQSLAEQPRKKRNRNALKLAHL